MIFHTHAHEGFADSDMSKGLSEGIWGAGEELKRILEEEYGIGVLHDDGQYDVVNGKGQITGAYERMEPPIRKILAEHPSIEVCIDLHRDGVGDSTRLVTNINGKPCAQVMFFNGLCRLNKNGTTQAISGLENPYLKENLAFSLQMKKAAGCALPRLQPQNLSQCVSVQPAHAAAFYTGLRSARRQIRRRKYGMLWNRWQKHSQAC